MAHQGLILGAASSNAGKTLITTGLLSALSAAGHDMIGAKTGPDYIDPAFHHAACGKPSVNLDPFAMSPQMLAYYAGRQPASHVLIEGVMGLFDGAVGLNVSTSTLASQLGLPVILIMNVRGQSQTAGYIAAALARLQPQITGVILNEVGSPRHADLIGSVLSQEGLHCFGAVPTSAELAIPSRHLGLVQIAELQADPQWANFIQRAGAIMAETCDLDAIIAAFGTLPDHDAPQLSSPPAQNITIVRDHAFGFAYHHQIENWRLKGANISFISALANEPAPEDSGFIFLPGGYPELHLPALSAASATFASLQKAAANNVPIYGECGGYMALGEAIIDQDGHAYQMAGLLPLTTSFAQRKRHLGYRRLAPLADTPAYLKNATHGHEYHFTTAITADGPPLFAAADATNSALGTTGLIKGSVCGSYCHII